MESDCTGVMEEGLAKDGTAEFSVMRRCQSLQDLGERAVNNAVR